MFNTIPSAIVSTLFSLLALPANLLQVSLVASWPPPSLFPMPSLGLPWPSCTMVSPSHILVLLLQQPQTTTQPATFMSTINSFTNILYFEDIRLGEIDESYSTLPMDIERNSALK